MSHICKGKKILWLLPGVIRGSGGHRTIIEKIRALDKLGAINLLHFYDVAPSRQHEMKTVLSSHFAYDSDLVFAGVVGGTTADIAIATLWDGVRVLRDVIAEHKVHFIQDFEAYFNAMGDGYLMAELAYQEPVEQIVLGKWLSNVMKSRFGKRPWTCEFGVDTNTYTLKKPWLERSRGVAFIYQPEKPRRAWRLGIEALGILKHRNPDVQIFLYGSDEKPNLWFENTHLGIINTSDLAQLYNSVQVGLCISSSNPSRIPFEMMACGLPLVDLYLSNNLYEYPDNSLLLAHTSPESIAAALELILNDQKMGEYLSYRSHGFVESMSEAAEHQQFVDALSAIVKRENAGIAKFPVTYNQNAVVASEFVSNKSVRSYCERQIAAL